MQFIQKIIHFIFQASISAIFFRLLILSCFTFFVAPYFFDHPISLRSKIEFFILSAILIEILSSKFNSISVYAQIPDGANKTGNFGTFTGAVESKYLSQASKQKPCFLFLQTKNVNLEEILQHNNYKIIGTENLIMGNAQYSNKLIKLFDNYYTTIIGSKLEDFRTIILDPSLQPLKRKIISTVKKNKHRSVTIVTNLDELISMAESGGGILLDLCYSFQLLNQELCQRNYINKLFGGKFSLNLLIDGVSNLQGFTEIYNMNKDGLEKAMSVAFLVDSSNYQATMQRFSSNFQKLLEHLTSKLLSDRIEGANLYQLAYGFSQQISLLRMPICKLIESIFAISGAGFITRRRQFIFTINFVIAPKKPVPNQQSSFLVPKEFEISGRT